MTWAQRLKRVFKIDIETCEHCGGQVKVIASIEDPQVIEKILGHIKKEQQQASMPSAQIDWLQHERAPPLLH
jgi:hypothetical protein